MCFPKLRKKIDIILIHYYIHSKMRNILIVSGDIHKVLLDHKDQLDDSKKLMLKDMESFRSTLIHSAPEALNTKYNFSTLQNIMNHHISGEDYNTHDWCKKCIDIFIDPNYGM